MPWMKVDDSLTGSRKWLSIPRKHRYEAVGVWVWAGSWSAKELTDGVIPKFMLEEWGVRKIIKDHLVSSSLWSEDEQNVFHSKWDEYQPMKSDVEADREKNREKLRKWRGANKGVTEGVTGLHTNVKPVSNRKPLPDPTHTLKETLSSEAAGAATRPEVESLLNLMEERVEANGSKKPSRSKKNHDAARLLIDRDGYTPEQVAWMIRWATNDEFWRQNILSMSKLREKFEQLKIKSGAGKQSGEIDPDAVLGKDYWACPDPPAELSMDEELAWRRDQREKRRAERIEQAKQKLRGDHASAV